MYRGLLCECSQYTRSAEREILHHILQTEREVKGFHVVKPINEGLANICPASKTTRAHQNLRLCSFIFMGAEHIDLTTTKS